MIRQIPAKIPLSEEAIGKLHDRLDTAVDFADTIYFALRTGSLGSDEPMQLATVVDNLAGQLKEIKQTLHDMIAWVE